LWLRPKNPAEAVQWTARKPRAAPLGTLRRTTGWQPHSVRGFLSGTIGKKMGLLVTSSKCEDGERSYSIKS